MPRSHIEIIYPETGGSGPLLRAPIQDHQPQPDLADEGPWPEIVGDATEFDLLIADHEAELILRAEAELEVLRRWIGLDRQAKDPAPSVPSHGDHTFGCVLYPRTAGGTLVPPAIVADLAKSGRERTHALGPDGQLANDQPAGRHFTAEQRQMIRLRDVRCQHPGCRVAARRCHHDHKQPSFRQGPTLVANGQLLCPLHHRWKHRHDPSGSRIFNDSPIRLQ